MEKKESKKEKAIPDRKWAGAVKCQGIWLWKYIYEFNIEFLPKVWWLAMIVLFLIYYKGGLLYLTLLSLIWDLKDIKVKFIAHNSPTIASAQKQYFISCNFMNGVQIVCLPIFVGEKILLSSNLNGIPGKTSPSSDMVSSHEYIEVFHD